MSRIPVPNGGLHHLSTSPTHSPMSSQNNSPAAAAADTRRKQSRRDEVSPCPLDFLPPLPRPAVSRFSLQHPQRHPPSPSLFGLFGQSNSGPMTSHAGLLASIAISQAPTCTTPIHHPPSFLSLSASVHSRRGAIRGFLARFTLSSIRPSVSETCRAAQLLIACTTLLCFVHD